MYTYIKHLQPHPSTAVSPADHAYDCPEAVLPPDLLRDQRTPAITLASIRAPLSWTGSPSSYLGDTKECHLQHTACCWGFLYTHNCEMWCTAILTFNCVSNSSCWCTSLLVIVSTSTSCNISGWLFPPSSSMPHPDTTACMSCQVTQNILHAVFLHTFTLS